MNSLSGIVGTADKFLSTIYSNTYVTQGAGLLLILYAALAAPQLSAQVAGLFENSLVKLSILSMILISLNYNPTIAILMAIGFVISMNTLSNYRIFAMANELDNIIGSPTKILQNSVEKTYENGAQGARLGDNGNMDNNKRTSSKFLNGMGPEGGSTSEYTVGYDGDALASYGEPGSQL